MVLGGVERPCGCVELLGDDDPVPLEIDALPAQRVKLAGSHPGERRDLQPCGERWAGERAGVPDPPPHLSLTRWLLVASALATRDAELLEGVAVDQPAGLGRGGIVEHRAEAPDRSCASAAGEPVRHDLIADLDERHLAVAVHERLGQLAAANVARLLRPGEQGIGRPALPESPDGHLARADAAQPFACLLACALRAALGRKRALTAEHGRDADVLARRGVVDLCAPAARWEAGDAHAARSCVSAQASAADGRKRRVRRPHVTDGIPAATIRSIVATLTPMIAASSLRAT